MEAGGDVAPTLTARYGKGADSTVSIPLAVVEAETYQKTTRPATSEHPDVWEHRDVAATLSPFDLGSETRAVELVVSTLQASGGDRGYRVDAEAAAGGHLVLEKPQAVLGDHTHSLTAEGHDASEDGTGRGTPVVAFHLTQDPISGAVSPAMGAKSTGMGIHTETVVRRLTPLECERLQGHPDNWTEGQADSHRYKQMGNGVAVPVFEWVAQRLAAAHAGTTKAVAE